MKDFHAQLERILDSYTADVAEVVNAAVKEQSKETVAELKQTSPKRKGSYARRWKMKTEKTLFSVFVVISNTHGQLTHLLEDGHALKNGGRTRAFPHIKTAEEHAKRELEEKIKNKLQRGANG